MEFLNEKEFEDLDKFIDQCTDKRAAVGDVENLVEAIDVISAIPISSSTVYAGVLSWDDSANGIEYYEQCIDQGIELNEEEIQKYNDLLIAEEIKNMENFLGQNPKNVI